MQQGKFKIALFGNIYQEKKSVAVQKFFAVAQELQADLLIPASFYDFLTSNLQIQHSIVDLRIMSTLPPTENINPAAAHHEPSRRFR